jgi:hypothetical protein
MLDNGDEGHIVNTASIAGLLTGANPDMFEAERNRADEHGDKTDVGSLRPDLQAFAAGFEAALKSGYPPEVVAEQVIDGIRGDRFYILPAQPEILAVVDERMAGIIERRNPVPR